MSSPPTPVYTVELDQAAAKLLRKLDRPVQARLVAAIAGLATQPRPAGAKALTGHPDRRIPHPHTANVSTYKTRLSAAELMGGARLTTPDQHPAGKG